MDQKAKNKSHPSKKNLYGPIVNPDEVNENRIIWKGLDEWHLSLSLSLIFKKW
ncbi:hypothetical protein YC2023_062889 [Brassica napus]